MSARISQPEYDDDYNDCACGDPDCPECGRDCSYCGGEGYGVVGADWDTDDAINGPYDGDIERCPNCGGSGDADDMTFW